VVSRFEIRRPHRAHFTRSGSSSRARRRLSKSVDMRRANVSRVHPRGRFHVQRVLLLFDSERGAEAPSNERAASGATRSWAAARAARATQTRAGKRSAGVVPQAPCYSDSLLPQRAGADRLTRHAASDSAARHRKLAPTLPSLRVGAVAFGERDCRSASPCSFCLSAKTGRLGTGRLGCVPRRRARATAGAASVARSPANRELVAETINPR
jgi:hypothetical protein